MIVPCLLLLGSVPRAVAHAPGEAYVYTDLQDDLLDGWVHIVAEDLIQVLPIDTNGDGKVAREEFERMVEPIRDYIAEHLAIVSKGEPVQLQFDAVEMMRLWFAKYVKLHFTGRHPGIGRNVALTIDYSMFFDDADPFHRGMVLFFDRRTEEAVRASVRADLYFYKNRRRHTMTGEAFHRVRAFRPAAEAGAVDVLTGFLYGTAASRYTVAAEAETDTKGGHALSGLEQLTSKTAPLHLFFFLALALQCGMVHREGRRGPTAHLGGSLVGAARCFVGFALAQAATLVLIVSVGVGLNTALALGCIALVTIGLGVHGVIPWVRRPAVGAAIAGVAFGLGLGDSLAYLELPAADAATPLIGYIAGSSAALLGLLLAGVLAGHVLSRWARYEKWILEPAGAALLFAGVIALVDVATG